MNTQKYLTIAGLSVVVLSVAYLVLERSHFDSGTSRPPTEHSISSTAEPKSGLNAAARGPEIPQKLSALMELRHDQRGRERTEDDELVDGTVLREWGTFVKARDVRINCRDDRVVIRPSPRPEDFVRKCDSKTVFDHPYAQFTDEQLEQIAGYDPAAAYILAYRMLMRPSNREVNNPQKGLTHALHSLVWTGEKQAFDLLIQGRHFPEWGVWSTVDGVPRDRQVSQKAEQYVWVKAGRNIGFIKEMDFQWQELSVQMERYEEYFDIETLNRRASEISTLVRTQRSRVTGKE